MRDLQQYTLHVAIIWIAHPTTCQACAVKKSSLIVVVCVIRCIYLQ